MRPRVSALSGALFLSLAGPVVSLRTCTRPCPRLGKRGGRQRLSLALARPCHTCDFLPTSAAVPIPACYASYALGESLRGNGLLCWLCYKTWLSVRHVVPTGPVRGCFLSPAASSRSVRRYQNLAGASHNTFKEKENVCEIFHV